MLPYFRYMVIPLPDILIVSTFTLWIIIIGMRILLNWRNAPNLEGKQVRITDVGGTAHVAGEIVVDKTAAYHQLDVTELLRNCRGTRNNFCINKGGQTIG